VKHNSWENVATREIVGYMAFITKEGQNKMNAGGLALTDRSKYQWFLNIKFITFPSGLAIIHVVDLTDRKPHGGCCQAWPFHKAAFKFFFYMAFQAIGVYFNLYYFLIPRYLERVVTSIYVGLLLLTIISTAALIVSGYYIGAFVLDKPFQELYHMDPANYFSLFEKWCTSFPPLQA